MTPDASTTKNGTAPPSAAAPRAAALRAFESARTGMATVTPAGRFSTVNAALAAALGAAPEALVGAPCPLARGREDERLAALWAGRRDGVSYAAGLVGPDGRSHSLLVDVSLAPGDPGPELVVCTMDITRRKAARHRARTANRYARTAFDRASGGIAVLDREGRFVQVNAAHAAIHGASVETMVGRHFTDYMPADARVGARAGYDAAIADRDWRVSQLELASLRPDGSRGLLRVDLAAVRDAHGDVVNTVASVLDMTEAKRVEAQTRESEERFRTAFEDANVGMALVALDGTFTRINTALALMVGYMPEELVGRTFAALRPQEDHGADAEELERLVTGQIPRLANEIRGLHAEGHTVWLRVNRSIVRNEAWEPIQLVAEVQDVTEQRAAEQALRESQERYRSLVEHLPMAIYCAAPGAMSSFVYLSPRIEELIGYTSDELSGEPELFIGLVHADDRDRLAEELCMQGLEGRAVACEYRVLARDGRTVTLRQRGDCVLDDLGWPLYVQGYLEDVTEQRRLEEQLRLAQKLESIGRLAGGIAHEINTPIQFVSDSVRFVGDGCTDLLDLTDAYATALADPADEAARAALEDAIDYADVPYLKERLPAAVERTQDGLRRVAEIVRATQDFAQPVGGDHTYVDVEEALRNTLVVTGNMHAHLADVETDFASVDPVLGDGGALNQVFVNVIENAAQAIARGSADGNGGGRGTIRVSTRQDGDEVVIAVADTGCGVAAEHRARVFDPFFTTQEVGSGTGQGLAVTRAIVCDQHRGHIALESELGTGTTFEIRLPTGPPVA